MPAIDHVFVLMLENRSFDHLFGLSGLVPRPTDPGFGQGATDRAAIDPPHEYKDVNDQIADGAMSGFSDPIMKKGLLPAQVPVVTQLAQEFVLFDNWFSSMPGPTWPNRFFVHCASSGGLATSPTQFQMGGAAIPGLSPFKFQGGSIYDRLTASNQKWRIYHGDVTPQVLAVPGLSKAFITSSDKFCPIYPGDPHFSDFATDVRTPGYEPAYTFIEPDYALNVGGGFTDGDSQHPKGLVSAGEALIKYVYESLRSSPIWSKCALLIVWDEHGGFYDHVKPPPATPPGDKPYNRPTNGSDPGFAFDRFGVRVPALLVSPLAPKGRLGSDLFPGKFFDHSSVIKSVFDNFGITAPLTARDAAAPSWHPCLTANARAGDADAPTVLASPPAVVGGPLGANVITAPQESADGFLSGMSLIALDLDRQVAKAAHKAPIANVKPQSIAQYRQARAASLKDPHFNLQLAEYINQVGVRVQAHRLRARLTAP